MIILLIIIIIRIVIIIFNNVNENDNKIVNDNYMQLLDFNLVAFILNLTLIRYSHLYSVINVNKMLS